MDKKTILVQQNGANQKTYSWNDARDYCINGHGTDLVSFSDTSELQSYVTLASNHGSSNKACWIGYSKQTAG